MEGSNTVQVSNVWSLVLMERVSEIVPYLRTWIFFYMVWYSMTSLILSPSILYGIVTA